MEEAKRKDYADRELDFDKEKIKRYNEIARARLEAKLTSVSVYSLKTF